MTNNDYVATRKFDKDFLCRNGFRYCRDISDDEEAAYVYRFPVYKYGISILIDCEIIVRIPSNEVTVNVVEHKSSARYAAWYYYEYGDFTPILDIINRNINKEISKKGIKMKDECVNSQRSDMPRVPKRRSRKKRKKEDCD